MRLLHAAVLALAVCPAAFVTSLTACSGKPDDSFQPSQTEDAKHGRVAARAMLGLAETPEIPNDPALHQEMTDYEAVAAEMLLVVEKREPGVFDGFGADVAAHDGDRFIAAWTGMRGKLQAAAESQELVDAVRGDPVFAGVEIQGFRLGEGLTPLDWSYQPPQDGIPNLGRGPDGWFGDGQVGPGAAANDLKGLLADPLTPWRTLEKVDSGQIKPDPSSRLGAYMCTGGYPPGTVGRAVHNAIGFIYMALGTYMEEKIGRVFCDPQSIALYNDPVNGPSSVRIAQIEQRYWDNVRMEDAWSAGGKLGAAFSPSARDFLQRRVFRKFPDLGGGNPGATPPSPGGPGAPDAGSDASMGPPSDCRGKSDGLWCIYEGSIGWMAYCKGGSIAYGCACPACKGMGGSPATCTCP
jgi:hypothetical protein